MVELWLTMFSSYASAVALSILGGVASNALITPLARQSGANILLSNDDGCEFTCRFPLRAYFNFLLLIRGCGKYSRVLSRARRCRFRCELQTRLFNLSLPLLTLFLSYTLRPFSLLLLRTNPAPDLQPLRLLPSLRRANLAVSP